MNRKKIAFLLACGVSMGFSAISGSSFAADSSTQKPAVAQSMASPKVQEKDHCDEHESGMMGAYGHGMMGEHEGGMMAGHGSGMMESPRMNMVRSLDLSDEQRSKINKLFDQMRHNNLIVEGSIMDESAKLRDLYEADKRDPATIGNAYRKIFDLKRQMIESMIDTQNHVEELLTPEQVVQLKGMRHMPGHMHGHKMN